MSIEKAQTIENKRSRLQGLISTFENQAHSILLHQDALESPMSLLGDYAEYDHIDDLEGTDDEKPGPPSPYHSTTNTDGSGVEILIPENIIIPLPSSFGWDWCVKHGLKFLAVKEAKLRFAQANDAIHRIHLALGFKSALFRTQVRHAKTQRMKTHAWNTVHGVDTTIQEHACVYSMARDACWRLRKALKKLSDLPKLHPEDLQVASHILGSAQVDQHNTQPSWIWSFGRTIEDNGTWMDSCK